MDKEELIKIRDKSAEYITFYAKKKRPFKFLSIPLFITSFILLIVAVVLVSSSDGLVEKPDYYFNLLYSSLAIFIGGIISLIIFLIFHFLEKKHQKIRDRASSKLLSSSIKKN